MKNIAILLTVLLNLSFFSCINSDIEKAHVDDQVDSQLHSNYTAIVSQSGVNEIVTNPSGKTWRDIHNSYLNEKARFSNPNDLQMFRSKMLHHLVKEFQITKQQDETVLPVLVYWAKEMKEMKIVNPQTAYLILERLSGFLTDGEIKQYAENYYLKAKEWKENNINPERKEAGYKIMNGAFKNDIQILYDEYEEGLAKLKALIEDKS